ncbi:hypothetical protein (nucleomorph) [Guillardia theta]|uniref:Uncharacterized protein n=1 Tax=Guillardia theta TaxID=55529 RepID=Q98RV2_GUITH|nr:hypothetical protein GTHECHR1056 [Guillardia theta]AAK39848.1 hypothetical protein [Guillardia theta]
MIIINYITETYNIKIKNLFIKEIIDKNLTNDSDRYFINIALHIDENLIDENSLVTASKIFFKKINLISKDNLHSNVETHLNFLTTFNFFTIDYSFFECFITNLKSSFDFTTDVFGISFDDKNLISKNIKLRSNIIKTSLFYFNQIFKKCFLFTEVTSYLFFIYQKKIINYSDSEIKELLFHKKRQNFYFSNFDYDLKNLNNRSRIFSKLKFRTYFRDLLENLANKNIYVIKCIVLIIIEIVWFIELNNCKNFIDFNLIGALFQYVKLLKNQILLTFMYTYAKTIIFNEVIFKKILSKFSNFFLKMIFYTNKNLCYLFFLQFISMKINQTYFNNNDHFIRLLSYYFSKNYSIYYKFTNLKPFFSPFLFLKIHNFCYNDCMFYNLNLCVVLKNEKIIKLNEPTKISVLQIMKSLLIKNNFKIYTIDIRKKGTDYYENMIYFYIHESVNLKFSISSIQILVDNGIILFSIFQRILSSFNYFYKRKKFMRSLLIDNFISNLHNISHFLIEIKYRFILQIKKITKKKKKILFLFRNFINLNKNIKIKIKKDVLFFKEGLSFSHIKKHFLFDNFIFNKHKMITLFCITNSAIIDFI